MARGGRREGSRQGGQVRNGTIPGFEGGLSMDKDTVEGKMVLNRIFSLKEDAGKAS